MSTNKIIKTAADHKAALARLDEIFDAAPGTREGDEAELLTVLIEKYEDVAFPIDLPSPVEAIKFRMEQQGLKPKDLAPYLGGASKVSEVLSGKRALSVGMMRNLHEKFGIPAEVLLREPGAKLAPADAAIAGKKYPVAEMVKRGWFAGFTGTVREAQAQLEDLFSSFAGALGVDALKPVLARQHIRNGSKQDAYALTAWRIRVTTLAMRESLPAYKKGTVNKALLSEVVKLSYLKDGPKLAKELLNKKGVHVIVEKHLPKTFLDGAAFSAQNGAPVVALTIRHDRLDNFWFTLLHELAHVAQHLDCDDIDAFFDDLSQKGTDDCEREADAMALEALIPAAKWRTARLSASSTPVEVVAFAEKLSISPAIPAGRIRHESGNFKVFGPLIGSKKVSEVFFAEA